MPLIRGFILLSHLTHTESTPLSYETELVPARLPVGMDGEAQVHFSRLLQGQHEAVKPAYDYADIADFQMAMPVAIESGLYIALNDHRYQSATQLVIAAQFLGTREKKAPGRNTGVVFGAEDFRVVGRTPLGDVRAEYGRMVPRPRGNYVDSPEVVAGRAKAASGRLAAKVRNLDSIEKRLREERKLSESLHHNLNPQYRPRYKVKNLEKVRAQLDERIHETAELATLNLNLGTAAVTGLHRAIHYNLYGYWQSTTLDARWRAYNAMVGSHATARIDRVVTARLDCSRELVRLAGIMQPAADTRSA